jgi:nucleoside-diphosphate-sugar epimerase
MPASSIDPILSEEVNYLATKNIAELCQLHEIETYVFASTCSVYGSQPNTLITEKSKVSPIDFYATQKYLSEKATRWLNRSPLIFRFGTLFGYSPRMRFDLVINLFVAQAIKEGKITVFGGNQNRPFLHVDDAAESIVFGLENNLTGTYNVITENFTMLQAAKKVSEITGCEIQIKPEVEDERHYEVSADKLSLTGFRPSKKLKDGIKEIIDIFSDGKIKDFNDKKYSNYEILLDKRETDELVKKRLFS